MRFNHHSSGVPCDRVYDTSNVPFDRVYDTSSVSFDHVYDTNSVSSDRIHDLHNVAMAGYRTFDCAPQSQNMINNMMYYQGI